MLSDELTDYHERALDAHTEWVKNYSRFTNQIETPVDYLQEKDVLPLTREGVQSRELAERFLPSDAFHIFYRVAPGRDQRVMVIAENPRFQPYSAEWYENKEGSDLLWTEGDIRKMAEVGQTRLLDYLLRTEGNNSNFWFDHLNSIFDEIPWLSGFDNKADEEMRKNPDQLYNEIYYTNAWKFATPNGVNPTKSRTDLAHPLLHEEIQIVDPELIVVCSGAAWRLLTGETISHSRYITSADVASLDGSPIEGPYEGTGPSQSAGGVFEINQRVTVTGKHPGRFGAQGTREALSRARDYL